MDFNKKFAKGLLEKYGLTPEELKNYIYVGSNRDKGREYFREKFPDNTPFPDDEKQCVCGHNIQENCYVCPDPRNGPYGIVVLGNCCVKKYIREKRSKTCQDCGEKHRNRNVDLCHNCRDDICLDCGKIMYGDHMCWR